MHVSMKRKIEIKVVERYLVIATCYHIENKI